MTYAFKVQQRFISFFGATYDIYDLATDQKIFIAKRQFFAIPPKIKIKDMAGNEDITIHSNFLFRNKWTIKHKGVVIGEVSFPIIRFFGFRFDLSLAGKKYSASNVFGYSFTAIDQTGNIGFKVDKKFLSLRDSFKVEVYPGLEPIFGIAAAIAIDSKYHES